jgi:Protein of unknown function (DUF3667)
MNPSSSAVCLNCNSPLTGPFCAQCGQKIPHTDPTLRELLHDATEELAHWEGKIPSTLTTLLLKPGVLTRDFLAGRRARWLPPLRVYLICSLAYFASGPLIEAITHRPAQGAIKFGISNTRGSGALTPEERAELEAGWPARLFGMERLERAAADPVAVNHAINSVLPKAMFVLLPIFALLTHVAWKRQMPRYPAHLYLALHVHAVWFAALTLSTIVAGFGTFRAVQASAGMVLFGYMVWYALTAMHRLFGESWPRTIAKAAAIALVYVVCQITTGFVLLAYTLTRM